MARFTVACIRRLKSNRSWRSWTEARWMNWPSEWHASTYPCDYFANNFCLLDTIYHKVELRKSSTIERRRVNSNNWRTVCSWTGLAKRSWTSSTTASWGTKLNESKGDWHRSRPQNWMRTSGPRSGRVWLWMWLREVCHGRTLKSKTIANLRWSIGVIYRSTIKSSRPMNWPN